MKYLKTILITVVLAWAEFSIAGSFTFSTGPEQVGAGGSHPMAIPPTNPYQWGLTWVTDGGFESTLGLCPGLLFGKRFDSDGLYVSVGAGAIVGNGETGFGPYSTLGYQSGGGKAGWHFTSSYTQAIGIAKGKYIAPSSMRFGAVLEY